MVGEASGRMQKADCRDEIALPAAMLAWLKYRKQRTRNSRKRFLVFFCSLFVKARVVYRLRFTGYFLQMKKERLRKIRYRSCLIFHLRFYFIHLFFFFLCIW